VQNDARGLAPIDPIARIEKPKIGHEMSLMVRRQGVGAGRLVSDIRFERRLAYDRLSLLRGETSFAFESGTMVAPCAQVPTSSPATSQLAGSQ
jgi:hypothetical protein